VWFPMEKRKKATKKLAHLIFDCRPFDYFYFTSTPP